MPGIDGWETIRRLRAARRPPGEPRIAIISANAFDKGLDNDLGIPRRPTSSSSRCGVSDLLDWLGRPAGAAWV